ncbi:UNVERIFIED_CONTAM: D-lactate ferricytochrome c oxidoreductase [Siphonaria sp. JEL0065]|nr:D-lactate ferricytochrome c oxidoreductase [Siphonaria sp. JEL0065]
MSKLNQFLSELESKLKTESGKGIRIKTDQRTLQRLSHDQSYHKSREPGAVVSVATEQNVSLVMTLAHKHTVPVVPFAAGSSLEGQTLALDHGIILDFSDMDQVVAVHKDDLDCVVEPGVGWGELKEALKPTGLFFPPDPGAAACIGGMCGTNCSGTLAFRYGTMKDNVLSLRVVLADGTIVKTRNRAVKSSAGYDLTRLFIGSEGTLGLVTQATLRLRRIPTHSKVIIAQFPTLASSASAVQALVQSGAPFLRLEIIDDVCIKAVNNEIEDPKLKFAELTTIMAECAGTSDDAVSEQIQTFKQAGGSVATNVTLATNEKEAERLWNLRKRAFFSAPSLRHHEKNKEWSTIVTDVAVPISRLVDILVATKKLIADANLVSPIVAHAGDGNFHCLIVVDKNDTAELQRAKTMRDEMARLALEMQGTCTGEHGIGIGKMHLLEEELGEGGIQVMRKVKKALDPKNILNPGKIFILEKDGAKESLDISAKSKL